MYNQSRRPLLLRLLSVARQPWASRYDHLIFHEADLSQEHKALFQATSPGITLRFINVQRVFDEGWRLHANWSATIAHNSVAHRQRAQRQGATCWDTRNATAAAALALKNTGYKSMCRFWYAEFLKFTVAYQTLLRIDDDIVLDPHIPDDPAPGRGNLIPVNCVHKMWYDNPNVVRGLGLFFTLLADRAHIVYGKKGSQPQNPFHGQYRKGLNAEWPSPYSNIVWFNLTWAREQQWIYDAVDETQCIFHNRWGDHVLWGATLKMLLIDFWHVRTMTLPHCHGSATKDSWCDLNACRGREGQGCPLSRAKRRAIGSNQTTTSRHRG